MKVFYILLLLSSLILNGYLISNQSKNKVDRDLQQKTEESISSNINLEVNDEVARLQSKLTQAEIELERLKRLSEETSPQLYDSLVKSKSNLVEQNTNQYLYKDIKEKNQTQKMKYQAEEVDPGWAYDSEEHISSMITNSDLISEFSFHGVSCKTSMCKLTVTPYKDSDQQAVSILMGISMLAFDSDRFRDYHTRSVPNDETGELDIYFYPVDEETD